MQNPMMEASAKRQGSPIGDDGGKHPRIELYPFDIDTITAANLDNAIRGLPRDTQLTDLNIAVIYSNKDVAKFMLQYRTWFQKRAFSQQDEHYLRMYQMNNGKSRLKSLPVEIFSRAVVTYEAIFSATKDADKPDVALAAANKLIDYIICCYCTGTKIDFIEHYIPKMTAWFETAVQYIDRAGPRTSAHALDHHLSRPQTGMLQNGQSFGGFTIDAGAIVSPTGEQPPKQLGNLALASNGTAPADASASTSPIVIGQGLSTEHTPPKHPVPTAGDTDVPDFTANLEASIVDHRACLHWHRVFVSPAVKLRLEITFESMRRDNAITRLEGLSTVGILLYGRPGTGKSVLAYALAREFKLRLYDVNMSDINSKWQGESERYIEALFTHAINNQPAIIFIDEIDSWTRARSDASATAIKSTFLLHWSKLAHQGHRGVVVGASNLADRIDSAFLRRMGLKLRIRGPEAPERVDIVTDTLTNHMYADVAVRSYDTFMKDQEMKYLTGDQIKKAVLQSIMIPEAEVLKTDKWSKIKYGGEDLLVPIRSGTPDSDTLHKHYRDLTDDERRLVSHRMITWQDLMVPLLHLTELERGYHLTKYKMKLDEWTKQHGTVLPEQEQTSDLPTIPENW